MAPLQPADVVAPIGTEVGFDHAAHQFGEAGHSWRQLERVGETNKPGGYKVVFLRIHLTVSISTTATETVTGTVT